MKNLGIVFCLVVWGCSQGKIPNVAMQGEPVAKTVLQVSFDRSDPELQYMITVPAKETRSDSCLKAVG
ncbi:MAG: hypothetical protein PHI28_06260 [Mangrovibacterium sp.]|nr:hypothetical protein [Mangrovibacterium sp.]